MKRYVEKIIVPFLDEKRAALNVNKTHLALAIFDCFRRQTTPELLTFSPCSCNDAHVFLFSLMYHSFVNNITYTVIMISL